MDYGELFADGGREVGDVLAVDVYFGFLAGGVFDSYALAFDYDIPEGAGHAQHHAGDLADALEHSLRAH